GVVRDEQRAVVRRMANAILHRGPDDEGFYDGESVVLGMRRLSIIDVGGGQQPFSNEDGAVWTVCKGEIYTCGELRTTVHERGHRFPSGSDVEVIVHLYEEHGESFIDHLAGMFAIALWDARQNKLILVRDRMGIKPLYFCEQNGHFAWASEVK